MKIAIISDIHEDVESLKKAINIINQNKCDDIICLGDIIGCSSKYCEYPDTRNADECIKVLKDNNIKTVLGNHDLLHLRKTPKYDAGFNYPQDWYELDGIKREELSFKKTWIYYSEARTELSDSSKEFLLNNDEYLISEYNGIKLLFSHNYFPDFSGSLFTANLSIKNLNQHFEFMQNNNCKYSFCGHRHLQGIITSHKPSKNIILRNLQQFKYHRFGIEKLNGQMQYISIPAIADQRQLNGFIIFDTYTYEISIICIKINKPIFYERNRI